MGLIVAFVWILEHIGIPGKEMADKLAKQFIKINVIETNRHEIQPNRNKKIIKQKMREKQQRQWWFYRIQQKMREKRSTGRNRGEKTVKSHLRF